VVRTQNLVLWQLVERGWGTICYNSAGYEQLPEIPVRLPPMRTIDAPTGIPIMEIRRYGRHYREER